MSCFSELDTKNYFYIRKKKNLYKIMDVCMCVCQSDLLMIQYAMMLICKHSHHIVLASSSGDAS